MSVAGSRAIVSDVLVLHSSVPDESATLTWYADLTLGDHRVHTASTVVTRLDADTGLLIADNVMSEHFTSTFERTGRLMVDAPRVRGAEEFIDN